MASTNVAESVETHDVPLEHKPMTPPTSEEGRKPDAAHSDLSDLDLDDDDEDIEPAYYYDGGKIPVFEPTMDQFRDFRRFIDKIDHYGMKSGIVKVVPPKEWTESLPALDEAVKTIKVKNPITQEFSGKSGTFTVANSEKQRSYNLPQWKALTEETHHQPPARRGERRKQVEKPKPTTTRSRAAASNASDEPPTKRARGRPRRNEPDEADSQGGDEDEDNNAASRDSSLIRAPPTPTSPETKPSPTTAKRGRGGKRGRGSRGGRGGGGGGGRPRGAQVKSTTERRKYNQAVKEEEIDHAAFEDFDYRFDGNEEFTRERCAELETLYWKGLTFAPPMYGADMPGGLFEESQDVWNVAKLPNLLDVLGTKVPGVNTAYLYLGMWKATFAWHLEDVDLYSINYIHFGAPKQWYSISQEDARKFEKVMRELWPNDSKNCSQFLRHKTYLISPSLLKERGITVNRLVHNEGEFVITYPYGYHSGYNLGYNCAESVNFATEQWLDYGRIAKKCDCEADSVWVDVNEIERKLRGEPTPEYYEETDDEEELDEETGLPSPPPSVKGKKRKRGPGAPAKKVKKIKIRIRTNKHEPCCLCPNDMPFYPLLPTDNGKQAHELCAQYTTETSVAEDESGSKCVKGTDSIDKARLELKCNLCRSKKGACFQCSEKKCVRAYHATCAAAAGVRVDFGPTPVLYTEEGSEYYQELFDFRCRYHRNKRPNWKAFNPEPYESSKIIRKYMDQIQPGDVVQAQMLTNLGPENKRTLGDIFGGPVVEKRPSEQTVLIDYLPEGDRVEVEYKWILAPDLEEPKQPKPSPNAKPLPPEMEAQSEETQTSKGHRPPRPDDVFVEGYSWGEYIPGHLPKNPNQARINLAENNRIWYYLGDMSTDTRASFTEDVQKQRPNASAIFMDTVRPKYVNPPPPAAPHQSLQAPKPSYISNTVRPYPGQPLQPAPTVRPSPTMHNQPQHARPFNMPAPPLNANGSPQSPPQNSNGYYPAQRPNPYMQNLPYGVGSVRTPYVQSRSQYSPTNNAFPKMPMSGNMQAPRRASNASMSPPAPSPTAQSSTNARSNSVSSQAPAPLAMSRPSSSSAGTPATSTSDYQYQSQYSPLIDYIDHLKKYPYLKDAWMRRPKAYRSAYNVSNDTGFAAQYQNAATQAVTGRIAPVQSYEQSSNRPGSANLPPQPPAA